MKKIIYATKLTTLFLVTSLLMLAMTLVSFGFKYQEEAKEIMKNIDYQEEESSVIYDKTGKQVLYEIHGKERRDVVSYSEIPDSVRFATIAAEDQSFYSHDGFDLKAIARAFKKNVENNGIVQGGSTITQQLARHMYLSREQTYERKIKEIFISREMEKSMSKDEILNKYLNQINYGSNVHGISKAADYYFNKKAVDLTCDEAALLAALPKAPNFYFPYGENMNKLVQRQKAIIWQMEKLGLINNKELIGALQSDTISKIKKHKDEIRAPHFVNYVLEQIKKEYGEDYIKRGGLKIVTTLDYEMQQEAEELLKESKSHLEDFDAENAAIVAINPKSEEVLAMAGSVDFFSDEIDGEVNVTTRSRQPGSSFKPIVYAKAFSKGYQPETVLYDVRTNFGPDGSGKDYIPGNYSGGYAGKVSIREALGSSLNIPAVKTLYLAGIDETLDFAEGLGISTLQERDRYGLSLALGGGGVQLLELAGAFGTFAADGRVVNPIAIREITGNTQVDPDLNLKTKGGDKKIETETARKINSILSDKQARSLTFGTDNSLEIPGKTVAVKTGTTQNYRDAWTIGYTPSLVVGVWAGNNDNSPMTGGAAGSYVAAPIWNKFMSKQLEKIPDEKFNDYESVESDNYMVTGRLEEGVSYYHDKSGEIIKSPEKEDLEDVREKIERASHSLLHYVDKNNPLTKKANFSDPMYGRWEGAINSGP